MGRESADRFARQLDGVAAPSHDRRLQAMVRAAHALQPGEQLSRRAHERGKNAMLAAYRRALSPVESRENAGSRDDHGSAVAPHVVQVITPNGLRVVMADLEEITPQRAAEIAKQAAELLKLHAPAEEPL